MGKEGHIETTELMNLVLQENFKVLTGRSPLNRYRTGTTGPVSLFGQLRPKASVSEEKRLRCQDDPDCFLLSEQMPAVFPRFLGANGVLCLLHLYLQSLRLRQSS